MCRCGNSRIPILDAPLKDEDVSIQCVFGILKTPFKCKHNLLDNSILNHLGYSCSLRQFSKCFKCII
ncbi:Hypothetical predicted protein [Podarcis lilfordi]|uniref:Uncharacterized protein n=1 Tax=Podarcis lilfordi TaxID=74358 RepID=A0AA35PSB9_9SAUR|nr:Hypothetical predicted protein [Podarcis lilfordi]